MNRFSEFAGWKLANPMARESPRGLIKDKNDNFWRLKQTDDGLRTYVKYSKKLISL